MSKFLGFLLGIAVALVGPAMFGVLAADGGIKLNAKEMALAYGIGALIFWTVASYFSGAAALGAALTFGAMIYTVHWIPNRLTNFLNDVPGVTTGMIDGIKQYTLNGVVPILAVISLIFGIQSIVRSVQRRRRERAEADRRQREQEAAVQAQQMPEPPTAAYPVAAGDYPPDNRFGSNFGNSNYDDLFEEEPAQTAFSPRNQADEQTAQFDPATTAMEYSDERDETPDNEDDGADETVLVPTDSDETVLVPAGDKTVADDTDPDETVIAAPPQAENTPEAATQQVEEPQDAPTQAGAEQTATQAGAEQTAARQGVGSQGVADEDATQQVPVAEAEEPQVREPESEVAHGGTPQSGGSQSGGSEGSTQGATSQARGVDPEATQPVPVPEPEAPRPVAPRVAGAQQGAAAPHAAGEVPQSAGPQTAAPQAAGDVPRSAAPQSAAPQAAAGGAAGAFSQGSPSTGSAPQDAGAQDAGAQDAGAQDAGPQDAGAPGKPSQVDDEGEATQSMPVPRPEAAAAPAPQAPAPQPPAPPTAAPQAPAQQGGGTPHPASWVEDEGEATQAVPVSRPEAPQAAASQAGLYRKEEMGQQYRERMDPPDVDDTGEFFVGAFENPTEQPSPRMELPGHFRPAGT